MLTLSIMHRNRIHFGKREGSLVTFGILFLKTRITGCLQNIALNFQRVLLASDQSIKDQTTLSFFSPLYFPQLSSDLTMDLFKEPHQVPLHPLFMLCCQVGYRVRNNFSKILGHSPHFLDVIQVVLVAPPRDQNFSFIFNVIVENIVIINL